MAETKKLPSKSLIYITQRKTNNDVVKQAEKIGYFFNPTKENVQTHCMKQNPQENNIEDFKLVCLNGLHLRSIGDITLCTKLRICLLANNYISSIDSLAMCRNLIKLDLHSNQLTSIPDTLFWKSLNKLQVLNLHDNPLGQMEILQVLSSSLCLSILTLYDTPLSLKKNYRHHAVNSIWTLKALDKLVISDEEIIEDATFTNNKFTTRCPAFKIILCPAASSEPQYKQEMILLCALLAQVNSILARHSPVLIVQKYWRGFLVRNQKNSFRKKLSPIRSVEIMTHPPSTPVLHPPSTPVHQPPSTPVHADSPAWQVYAGVEDYEQYSRKPCLPNLSLNVKLAVPYGQSSSLQGQGLHSEDHPIYINIQKLRSEVASCLQADNVAMEKALAGMEGQGLVSRKVAKEKKQGMEEKDEIPKSKRIKDIKQFFGPVVQTTVLPEIEESDFLENNFRLRGRKTEILTTDATTEMILSKRDAGYIVREAEMERLKMKFMESPVKVNHVNFTTTQQRLFNKAHETMGLSCMMAVYKAYKERNKVENSEAKSEYILGLRNERMDGKMRINKFHEERRAKALKSKLVDRSQIAEIKEKQELQRLNLLDKLQEQKVQSSDLIKAQKANDVFMQEFICQQTSVSNALQRYDYQAHVDDIKNDRQKFVSNIKKHDQDQKSVVKKYMDRRRLLRQSEVAKVKADLSVTLVNNATNRIVEAKSRVAYLKAPERCIQCVDLFALKKNCHADPADVVGMSLRKAVLQI